MPALDGTIEVVRGQMTDERADKLLGFWSTQRALDEAAARERLGEVVCVLRDGAGEIAGVNSVYPQSVPLVGGRPFWMYRSMLLPAVSSADPEMINAAFSALEDEFEPTASGPVGLCLVVGDRAEMDRHPEAIWPESKLMFAGYLEDGRQLRIRYFEGAAIGPGLPDPAGLAGTGEVEHALEDRYRIGPLGEATGANPEDILAFWEREGAVPSAEAQRRVHQILLVAVERAEGVVGVSSAYLGRNPQLRMDLWHFRVFVARAHRRSDLALVLAVRARDLLERRFVDREDTQAAGIVYEVEHEGLKRHFNTALWPRTGFTFIGENQAGDHVRVHYFPGALAPLPGRPLDLRPASR
jgi:hypothetical protein